MSTGLRSHHPLDPDDEGELLAAKRVFPSQTMGLCPVNRPLACRTIAKDSTTEVLSLAT